MADEKPPPKVQPTAPLQPTPFMPYRLMGEGESAKAYAAFKMYFEMGDSRSIPGLLLICDCHRNSLFQWAKRFRWDDRIDYAHHEAMVDFARVTRRTNERIAAQNARFLGDVATKNQKIVTAFQDKSLDVVKAIQPLEQVSKVVSADGKTTHVVLKPAEGVRLTDAARLAVAATLLARQGDQLLTPDVRGSKGGNGRGLPSPDPLADIPEVVVFLDTGDGTPGSLATLPPPDTLNENFDPMTGTITDGNAATP